MTDTILDLIKDISQTDGELERQELKALLNASQAQIKRFKDEVPKIVSKRKVRLQK